MEQRPAEPSSRLFNAWKWLDGKAFQSKISAAEHSEGLADISSEFDVEKWAGFSTATFDDVARCIGRHGSDLIVWMLPDRPPAGLVSATKLGIWTIAGAFHTAFGFRELADHEHATRCDLIILGDSPSDDSILATTYAATDGLSLARGINGMRVKCEALLLSTITRAHRGTELKEGGLPEIRTDLLHIETPGFLQLSWGLMRIYGRYFTQLLTRPFYFDQWQIAYRIGGDRLDQKGLQRLAPSHKGFWADPFVAERDGRKFIFFEEYLPETARGHIAAVEVYPNGQLGEPVNVLMRDYHFSYPFLFEYDGSLFMIPECAEAGRVEVFRCERFPDRWESHAVLMEGVRAFDPTLVEHDGLWWMFMTMQHDGNSVNDELHLFYATGPFDEWTPHPLNPVRLDVRAARPAGAIFRDEGKLLRPAQDCSGRYGWAISIQEVLCMTTERYEEIERRRISADWAAGSHATHTINQASGVTVYDCEARCRK